MSDAFRKGLEAQAASMHEFKDEPTAAQGQREPQYVYAESREEAQRLLDNSYLKKYRAVPVRWWRRWLHAR